jgi:hypothetical protein
MALQSADQVMACTRTTGCQRPTHWLYWPPCLQDLKRVLKTAGLEGRDVVFLFSDTQIIHEGFLEDLNNILNAGG